MLLDLGKCVYFDQPPEGDVTFRYASADEQIRIAINRFPGAAIGHLDVVCSWFLFVCCGNEFIVTQESKCVYCRDLSAVCGGRWSI